MNWINEVHDVVNYDVMMFNFINLIENNIIVFCYSVIYARNIHLFKQASSYRSNIENPFIAPIILYVLLVSDRS